MKVVRGSVAYRPFCVMFRVAAPSPSVARARAVTPFLRGRRDSLREEGKVFLGAPLSFILRKVGEREGGFLLQQSSRAAEMVCLMQ